MSMFCYQCEQTARGEGCTKIGVCGKDPTTAQLQDVLTHLAKGVSWYMAKSDVRDETVDNYVLDALFATVTNVDFDPARIQELITQGLAVRSQAASLSGAATPHDPKHPAAFVPEDTIAALESQGQQFSIATEIDENGATLQGLRELPLYGLKGAAAYAHHAHALGKTSPQIYADFHRFLAYLADDPTDINELLQTALDVGELNYRVMELLDTANTDAYGHPEPTEVRVTPVAGKAILVSGHDLKDLAMLLEQTKDKGVNIYTHGEMLPCLAYPELKKYPHLVGNYGGAWQDQQREFDEFPGAILMTTNCIQKPAPSYKGRIFTAGLVAWPEVTHIGEDKDFTPVIEAALEAPGFTEDAPEKTIMIGFGHHSVLSVADQVVEAVKSGAVRHFFLVGGCDGAKTGRNYYTEFAQEVPDDCMILTLACGKYRFNKMDFGTIGPFPRLLDIGQCNDAYSAIRIASALAEAFGCGVNDLPLSMVLSWYEQKAVAILLTLLYLGVQDIRLGPTVPAFLTEDAVGILAEKFGLAPISAPKDDLASLLQTT